CSGWRFRDQRRWERPRRRRGQPSQRVDGAAVFSSCEQPASWTARNDGVVLMSKQLTLALVILFGLSFGAPSRTRGQIDAPASHSVSVSELLRYEATGLSLLSPYTRGK